MTPVYIGIDSTAGRRPFTYAILDEKLRIVACGEGQFMEVVDLVAGQPAAAVAVDAPQSPNHGLMAQPEYRDKFGLPSHSQGWRDCKVAEYLLRRRGIGLYLTPRDPDRAAGWMRVGFQLYDALRAAGFQAYQPNAAVASGAAGDRGAPRVFLEVYPHGGFTVRLGHRPLRKDTLEGRLQRQIVLYDEGVDVPDPMDAVEELTRHHLREGTLVFPGLRTHDELDALMAAYTAFLAVRQPEAVTAVGDPVEGEIILPIAPADFKARYR